MTTEEKIMFVDNLCHSIAQTIEKNIENSNVPEEWDGVELRHYIAEIAARNAYVKMAPARRRKYRNAITINPNL